MESRWNVQSIIQEDLLKIQFQIVDLNKHFTLKKRNILHK